MKKIEKLRKELEKDKEGKRMMEKMLEYFSRPDHLGHINLDHYDRQLKMYARIEGVSVEELQELLETPTVKKRLTKERFLRKYNPYGDNPTFRK